jgi:DNA-binding CsgD family transcriptional regulator
MDALMLNRAENTVTVRETFTNSTNYAPLPVPNELAARGGCDRDLTHISSQGFLSYVVLVLAQAGRLTEVRSRVLELALLGRQYAEIAEILGKSPNTVASQVKAILDALGADSTRDLFRVFLNEVDRMHKRAVPGSLVKANAVGQA